MTPFITLNVLESGIVLLEGTTRPLKDNIGFTYQGTGSLPALAIVNLFVLASIRIPGLSFTSQFQYKGLFLQVE